MEFGVGADELRLVGEGGAAAVEGFGQRIDALEGPVGDGLVGERPEPFGGLQLRRIGRQEAEPDAVGRAQLLGDVPAGVVEQHDDDLVAAGADLGGEGVEHRLEQLGVDPVGQPPLDPTASRVDEAVEVEPLVFVMAERDRLLAAPGPDAPAERLQAETVLVEGPELDRPPFGLAPRRRHLAAKFFLNAACSSAVALRTWRGRGRCRLKPSRCR